MNSWSGAQTAAAPFGNTQVRRDDDVSTRPTGDLEVPDRAAALIALLRADDTGEPWTAADAHAVAHESDDDDLQVGDRTVRKYLKALTDAGALEKTEGDSPTDPNECRLE